MTARSSSLIVFSRRVGMSSSLRHTLYSAMIKLSGSRSTPEDGAVFATNDAYACDENQSTSSSGNHRLTDCESVEPQEYGNKRRHSSLASLFQKAKPSTEPYWQDAVRIMDAVSSPKRRVLINQLLTVAGDASVKIRFLHAVEQFAQSKSRVEREELGRAILKVFVLRTSKATSSNAYADMFCLAASLAPETLQRLKKDRLEFLEDARREILAELCSDADFMQVFNSLA